MKTTIELPEALFLAAKRKALERGTTLRALIEMGLRTVLEQSPRSQHEPYCFPVITTMMQPAAGDGDLNTFIDQIRNEQLHQLLPR
jgi:hypothetical protein